MPDSGVHREMESVLKLQFPGLVIVSTYREGARTHATNSLSYHALGKAVDMAPRMEVFEWIRVNYPNSRELIFSPAGDRQIHNGQPHVYTGVTKADHYDHVHWAVNSLAEGATGGSGPVSSSSAPVNNPLIPDAIEPFVNFFQYLTNPGIWVRFGLALFGAALLAIAFARLAGRKIGLP